PGLRLRAVAEDRLQREPLLEVHHRPGLADHRLAWVQLDLHELHVVTEDLVVDLVHRGHGRVLLSHVARRRPDRAHWDYAGARQSVTSSSCSRSNVSKRARPWTSSGPKR